jgi:preprotein translocase SecE subunit
MIIVALVAFDFGIAAWGQWRSILDTPGAVPLMTKVSLGVLVVLTAAVGIGGFIMVGLYHKSAQFLIEVEGEMGKVTWPAKHELIRLTIAICVISLLLTASIFLVDWLILGLKNLLFYHSWERI